MFFSMPSASLWLIFTDNYLLRFCLRKQDLVKEETWLKNSGLTAWLNTGVSQRD